MEQDKDIFVTRMTELYRISGCPSVTQFAKQIGLKRQTVDKYLSGVQKADMPSIKQICMAMNITSDWLLGLSDVMSPSADIQSAVAALGITEGAARRIVDPDVYGSKREALSHLLERSEFKDLLDAYVNLLKLISYITAEKRLCDYVDGEDYIIEDNGQVTIPSPYKAISVIESSMQLTCSFLCEGVRLERAGEIVTEQQHTKQDEGKE